MKKTVNSMGDACPIPVVKTKEAIRELSGQAGTVETLVDNEIAVQNLTKMAVQKGYGVTSEKLGENQFRVTMTIAGTETGSGDVQNPEGDDTRTLPEEPVCVPDARRKHTVVAISSSAMGSGSDELGTALMKAFLYALAQQDTLPSTILFYNGGARLTCEGAATLEDLKALEAQGVEIMTCGTCLNFYGLTEKLQVGTVTNMYAIVEKLTQADLVIRP